MDTKRLVWVVLLLSGGLLLLTLYVRQEQAKRRSVPDESPAPAAQTQPAAQTMPSTQQAASPGEGEPAARPEPAGPAAPPAAGEWVYARGTPGKFAIGSLDAQSPYLFQVELNTEGAAVYTLKLTRFFETVEDKRLFDKDPQAYQAARLEDPEKYEGHYNLLNPVSHEQTVYLPLATRRVSLTLPDSAEPVAVRLDNKHWDLDPATPATLPDGSEKIRFTWTLYRRSPSGDAGGTSEPRPFLRLAKTYQVSANSYSLGMQLELENLSGLPLKVAVDQAGPTGLPREDIRSDNRSAAYGKTRGQDQRVQPTLKPNKELAKMALGQPVTVGGSADEQAALWLGHVNKFFGSIMYLIPASPEKSPAAQELKASFYVSAAQESPTSRTFLTGVELPAMSLGAGESRQVGFDVFAGPKLRGLFSRHELYKKLNYLGTIDFGSCFCASDQLTLGMMWLLEKLSVVSLGNYGVAIIMLVLLVRVVLHPLTKKSQVSMMKMQKLAPQMEKLKEKYADDKNALNREMMQLYKSAGATPILGCLPMLLQMPIWIALWTALNATVELRHAAFLPVWITDLAAPDSLFRWTQPLPVIGTMFNLLPILLTVAMFLQSKLNPQMTQMTTPQQSQQQKMMTVMMPVMMLFIFYNAPSGLTLYIMASTFAGVAEQYVIRRHIQQRQAREAAVETTVSLPGKGPRAARPKKPKGPLWFKR